MISLSSTSYSSISSFAVAAGQSIQVYALARFSNGTLYDATGNATWSSTDAAVATVSGGLVTGVAGGSSQITASISLVAQGQRSFGCGGCPGQQEMSAGATADVCDFVINGAPAPATCDGKTKNTTIFQASGIPDVCTVYAAGSKLTFLTDGIKVTPDYADSSVSYDTGPQLSAVYWVTSTGGTITPQFTIAFNAGQAKKSHDETLSVSCK